MFYIYLALINFFALFLFGFDKKQAKKRKRRVPEKQLFLVAFLGGSFGGLLGMVCFHHKTRKVQFFIGVPLILLIQIFLFIFVKENAFLRV